MNIRYTVGNVSIALDERGALWIDVLDGTGGAVVNTLCVGSTFEENAAVQNALTVLVQEQGKRLQNEENKKARAAAEAQAPQAGSRGLHLK